MSGSSVTSDAALYGGDASIPARKTALRRGEVPLAVYGLGKIGLPVAAAFADLTGAVTGVDTDPAVVDAVDAGRPPFEHEPGLAEILPELTGDGRLAVTDDGKQAAADASLHIVVVPVPMTAEYEPDLSAVRSVLDTIGAGLDPGDLVVVETTVPPGTAAEHVRPRLAEQSGLDPQAFGVASCPERTSSGRALRDIHGAYPRVIGGVDADSTDAAYAVYDELVDNEVITADARTAEAVKLFEGVYRDVNIALANELAKAFDGTGIEVREAIGAANTQPYCDIHDPGAGVGGHCIPWYPHFLRGATDVEMPLVETARRVNDGMPDYLADQTLDTLAAAGVRAESARVCVLGLAYRPEIAETAASPTFRLVGRLRDAGSEVAVVDPVVPATDTSLDLLPIAEIGSFDPDALVMVTPHEAFDAIPVSLLEDCIVVDGRDALGDAADYVVGRDR